MSIDQNISRIRAAFPHLQTCTYLDTGATGLAAPGIGLAAAAFYDRLLSRGFDAAEEWRQLAVRVRSQLAVLLNVSPDDISFMSTSSDAMNRLAQALPIAPGDKIVMAVDEFPTLEAVISELTLRGAVLNRIAIDREENRTQLPCAATAGARFVAVSHVHWSTGSRVDLAQLSRACAKSGAYLLVDGVHAVGAVPVDASLADAYVTSFFKWTLAGFGLGALILRSPLKELVVPCQRGYANLAPSRSLQHSHLNYPGLAALERALDYLSGIGWNDIFGRVARLQEDLAARLAHQGIEILTPTDAAGLTCVPVASPEDTALRLGAMGIRVSPRGSAIRVSTHFYNLASENERFCEALASCVEH
ncbi:MAG: aminotransferase class V-fold PLP-dependent enzyme [Burkholderiaceae bacterium]